MMIFTRAYEALNDSSVVKEAAPAMSGNTSGTSVLDPPGASLRNISYPNIISKASKNKIIAPAAAKL